MPSPPQVVLVDINSTNWRDVVAVTARPDQEEFTQPVAYYLNLAHYGDDWTPLGIEFAGAVVGHVMWAIDEEDGSVWLGGLIVDAALQGRGIGRAAVQAFLDRFTTNGRVDVALSYSPGNTVAGRLYGDIGFVETGETEGDEVVARYRRDPSRT